MGLELRYFKKVVKDIIARVGEDIPVKYYFDKPNDKKKTLVSYVTSKEPCIMINTYWLEHLKINTIKVAVLHEIGHIYCGITNKAYGLMEYEAQMWVINTARETGLKSVEKRALQTFTDWSTENKRSRYYLAYLMAKKEGII
jgi:hypothetical protein